MTEKKKRRKNRRRYVRIPDKHRVLGPLHGQPSLGSSQFCIQYGTSRCAHDGIVHQCHEFDIEHAACAYAAHTHSIPLAIVAVESGLWAVVLVQYNDGWTWHGVAAHVVRIGLIRC